MDATLTPRAKRTPTLAFALTALTLGSASATATAQEVAWAYVSPYQSQLIGTTTPQASYQRSPTSNPITVTRDSRGQWAVRIPRTGLGLGVFHASAYGGNHSMVVVHPGGYTMVSGVPVVTYTVRAYSPSGQLVDGGFVVHYQRGGGFREAYAYSACESCPSSAAVSSRSFNATRGNPQITRTAVGRYVVRFPGLSNVGRPKGGHVQVTPAGYSFRRAKVEGWRAAGADLEVRVRTTNASGGPADGRFFVSFAERASTAAGASGYTWVNNPWASSSFPSSHYTDSNGIQSSGPIAVQRVGIGSYVVNFPRLIPFSSSTAQVTAYGSDSAFAAIEGWMGDGARGTIVRVKVFDAAGRPVDGRFDLQYLTTGPVLR